MSDKKNFGLKLDNVVVRKAFLMAGVCAVLFLILLILGPPFFTFDSYDYLHLSLFPKAGGSHPLGYGFILKILSWVSNFIGKQNFTEVVLFWNALSLSFMFYLGFNPLVKYFKPTLPKKQKIMFLLLSLFFLLPVVMGILFVSNAFWSEATNILHIGLFAILAGYARRISWPVGFILAFFLGAWSYQTRYSEIVLPICFLGLSFVYLVRFFGLGHNDEFKLRAIRFLILFFGAIIGLNVSSIAIKYAYPADDGQKYVTNLVVTASLQCALRCDVDLYQANCRSEEGRQIVEQSKCSELIFGLKPFGPMVLSPMAPIKEIFSHVGYSNVAKWAVIAPFTYLTDIHAMEMGLFQFADDKPAVDKYKEATAFYSDYLVTSAKKTPNAKFISMVQFLDVLFYKYKLFHIFTGIAVVLSIYLIFVTVDPVILVLSFQALGTYLLFAYLNPHVPFRYLMIIIFPAFVAGLIHFISRKLVRLNSSISRQGT